MRAIASGSLGPFLAPTHLHTYCAPISVTKLHPEYTVGRFQMKRQLQGTVRGPKGLRSEEGFLLDSKRVQIELSLWTPKIYCSQWVVVLVSGPAQGTAWRGWRPAAAL